MMEKKKLNFYFIFTSFFFLTLLFVLSRFSFFSTLKFCCFYLNRFSSFGCKNKIKPIHSPPTPLPPPPPPPKKKTTLFRMFIQFLKFYFNCFCSNFYQSVQCVTSCFVFLYLLITTITTLKWRQWYVVGWFRLKK